MWKVLVPTYAYTLDGDEEGEIQFENFNASTAFITIHGVSVHGISKRRDG